MNPLALRPVLPPRRDRRAITAFQAQENGEVNECDGQIHSYTPFACFDRIYRLEHRFRASGFRGAEDAA